MGGSLATVARRTRWLRGARGNARKWKFIFVDFVADEPAETRGCGEMMQPTTEQPGGARSTICREAFPAHPHFPQLTTACDAGLMLEVFRNHLKPVSDKAFHIQECIPLRFRWRKGGSRCVLQYTLRLVEKASGRRLETWVTSVFHAEPGRTKAFWAELNATEPRIPEEWLTFEPLAFVPDLQMLVQVFPWDRQLTTLPLVLGGPWPELQRQMLDCFGLGQWQAEQQAVETIRYRTELGAVLRYTLRARDAVTSQTQAKRFYAKVYANHHGERTCQLLQQLQNNARNARDGFLVANPLGYDHARHCLVLEEAPGRSLQEVFLRGEDLAPAARCVARAVAAFTESNVQPTRRHSPDEQMDCLERAAALLRWACPALCGVIDEIVRLVGAGLVDVACVPIHWDLKLDHIFLDNGRVVFVDLDTVSLGDPVRDPAHLLAHITCRIGIPAMPIESARAAARAFVEEYFAHVPAAWRKRLGVQYAAAVMESACGIFKRQEPLWFEQVVAAIEEAQRGLSENFW